MPPFVLELIACSCWTMCALSWHRCVPATCECLAKSVGRWISFIQIKCNSINVYESLINLIACMHVINCHQPLATTSWLHSFCMCYRIILLPCHYREMKWFVPSNQCIRSLSTCWWCPKIVIEYQWSIWRGGKWTFLCPWIGWHRVFWNWYVGRSLVLILLYNIFLHLPRQLQQILELHEFFLIASFSLATKALVAIMHC